jgi:hypothetical protein
MNGNNDDAQKSAGCGPADSEKNKTLLVSLLNPHITPRLLDCQISLEDALDLDMWDTEAWVECQLRGGFLTPRTARALYGVCPEDAAQYARENYSMSAGGAW